MELNCKTSEPDVTTRCLPGLLVVIVVLLVGLLVVLYFSVRSITTTAFDALENREVRENVARTSNALSTIIDSLSRTSADYAQWDDALSFVQGEDPTFLHDNVTASVMRNLGADFVVVLDPAGERPFDGVFLSYTGATQEIPARLRTALEAAVLTSRYEPSAKPGEGLFRTSDGDLFVLATSPVTSSDRSQSSGAFLGVGRLVDRRVLDEIEAAVRLPVDITAVSGAPSEPTPSPDSVEIEVVDEDSIRGTAYLRAIDGSIVAAMSVEVPRAVYFNGQKVVELLGYALLTFGVVSCLSVGYVIVLQSREMIRRRQAEYAMRFSEKHRHMVAKMADAVFGLTPEGTVDFANPQAARLVGLSQELLTGTRASTFMTGEGWERASRYLELETSVGTTDSFEVDIINASGRVVPVEIIAVPLLDGSDRTAGVQWTARDVTERRRLEKELVHLANQDHLTGLFNRRRFEEELSRATQHAVRTGRRGAVLWLDIDYFKEINDSLGHQAGDQVLIGLAATMRTQLRGDSVLARQGGDEFAVLLPEVSVRQAEECAVRLINAIRKTSCVFHDRDLRVTTSMGIVMFPDHGTDAEEILARADLAMYQAKDGGRNRYRMYEPGEGWHTEQKSRFKWVSTIERALAEDLFVVHAQPVVNMVTGEVDRHELLIRMEAENGDIVGPGEFLPTAERTGLIREIDQWMVRRAIDLVSMQAGRDASYRLDVNLSGKAFSDPELLPLIQSELIRTGIEPVSLGIEVTETAAIADMTKAREFITALRNLGCRVSLDDFGSGFSSFYYLKNLPVDCLKIDGGFVQDICNSTEDQHVVKAIVELAQGFGVTSTAEFVEDQATFEMLRSLGVTYAQGYHIARPIPVERLGGSGTRRSAEGA